MRILKNNEHDYYEMTQECFTEKLFNEIEENLRDTSEHHINYLVHVDNYRNIVIDVTTYPLCGSVLVTITLNKNIIQISKTTLDLARYNYIGILSRVLKASFSTIKCKEFINKD